MTTWGKIFLGLPLAAALYGLARLPAAIQGESAYPVSLGTLLFSIVTWLLCFGTLLGLSKDWRFTRLFLVIWCIAYLAKIFFRLSIGEISVLSFSLAILACAVIIAR